MIESVGIIGAGTMGNGIAQVSAAAGLSVTMVDISDAAVKRGLATIDGSLDRLVKTEKMAAADREAALKRIKNGRLYLIPASEETRGHGTTGMAKFYKQQLKDLLEPAPQRAM